MNPAEIVKKVLGEHELTGISYGRWECQCLAEGEYAPGAYRAHVTSEIVGALGNQLAPDGFVVSHCARRGEPILVPRTDPTNEAMLLCDPCNVALIRKIHGRDQ